MPLNSTDTTLQQMMAKEVKINRTGVAVIGALGVVVIVFLVYQTRGGGYVEKTVKISELISASISLVEKAGKVVVSVRKMDDKEIEVVAKGLTKEGKNEYVTLGDKVRVFVFIWYDPCIYFWSSIFQVVTSNHRFWTKINLAKLTVPV